MLSASGAGRSAFAISELGAVVRPVGPGQDPRAAGTLEPLWNLMT